MKLSLAQAIAALSLWALQAPGASASPALLPRQNVDCIEAARALGSYNNQYSPACAVLASACALHANVTVDLWTSKTCVAAATCQGTRNLLILAECGETTEMINPVPSAVDQPHLDYNIYAGIVGDCAWQPGGCPITQQNYIDFVYGALSDLGSTIWPSSAENVVEFWWDPIIAWTLTGNTVPYKNFDDWLHYSNS